MFGIPSPGLSHWALLQVRCGANPCSLQLLDHSIADAMEGFVWHMLPITAISLIH
jgi:hypothetical protein